MKYCNWCQRKIYGDDQTAVIDRLVFHQHNGRGAWQSCLDAYRDYCRWIKEHSDDLPGKAA
jgi:hypothetical protein